MAKTAQQLQNEALAKALRESVALQSSLARSNDEFINMSKLAGDTSKEVDNIKSLSTDLNNLLKDSVAFQSKIGKEYIKISSLNKEILKFQETSAQITERIRISTSKAALSNSNIRGDLKKAAAEYLKISDSEREIARLSQKIAIDKNGLVKNTIANQKIQAKILAETNTISQATNDLGLLQINNDVRRISFLEEQKRLSDENAKNLIKQKPIQEATNKLLDIQNEKLGSLGAIVKGISKIPILGNLIQTQKILDRMEESIQNGGSRWSAFSVGIKSTFNEIGRLLSDPLIVAGILVGLVTKLTQEVFKFEKSITDTANILASTKESTQDIYKNFENISISGNKIVDNLDAAFLSITNQGNALNELNAGFQSSVRFTDEQIQSQIMLTNQMGMATDEAASLMKLSLNNKTTVSDILKTTIKQNDSAISYRKIITDVAKISGQLLAQYKNNPEQLAKAVIQAEKLGITLEQAKKSSEFLLDFESSISAELEAELLLGKSLNLEKARSLALAGQSAEAAKDMLGQVGKFSDFQQLNIIQQNTLSRAVGMTTNELTDALREQQTLTELGVQDKQVIAEKLDMYKRLGNIDAQRNLEAEILSKTNGDILLKNISQASLQQKFEESMERVKELFVSIASGPMISILNSIAKLLSNTVLLKGLLIASGAALAFMATKAILTAGASIASAIAIGNIPGAVLGGIALASATAAGVATGVAVNDAVINPNGGIVISTPEGQIIPNKKDSVITTTNPGGLLSGGNNRGIENKLDAMIALMQKGGNVYMDSTRVGTVQGMSYNAFA